MVPTTLTVAFKRLLIKKFLNELMKYRPNMLLSFEYAPTFIEKKGVKFYRENQLIVSSIVLPLERLTKMTELSKYSKMAHKIINFHSSHERFLLMHNEYLQD